MSGPGSLASRPLSTTEELEKLEQSITLTLQEIDHNFSRAHQIVTGSILPVVEQYGEHCRSVWDASKFWKQFFEAAANVSLSGYEELANDEESTGVEETITDAYNESTTSYTARPRESEGNEQGAVYHDTRDESLLTDGDGDLSGSTPRPPTTKSLRPQFAELDSPYERLRREMKPSSSAPRSRSPSRSQSRSRSRPPRERGASVTSDVDAGDESTVMRFDDDEGYTRTGNYHDDSSAANSELLAQSTARLPNMSMTPRQSLDERSRRALEDEKANARRQKDPLMHHALGKDYRIQSTPHKTAARGISPMRLKVSGRQPTDLRNPGIKEERVKRPAWQESSPMSSPEIAVPKLRSAAFLSPVRAAYRNKLLAAASGPRTPGVSVQTPARSKSREITFKDIEPTETGSKSGLVRERVAVGKKERNPDEIMWDSSDDDGDDLYGGMSPPKTISFALPPSKLLQTPAREASKRIVEDILLTAGEGLDSSSDYSPTMVKVNTDILDETF
ncbi:hypothetical protein SEPCBS119000_001981 [Sporothrix epigloea]|uniref:DASH complex subunit ASK1 n=1 Tax=Sporothrix epigloea TaxID=1892477 RepID=A0ABP0DGZ0_9PEZI